MQLRIDPARAAASVAASLSALACGGSASTIIAGGDGSVDSGSAGTAPDGALDSGNADATGDGVLDSATTDATSGPDATARGDTGADSPSEGEASSDSSSGGSSSSALRFDGIGSYLSLPASTGGTTEAAFSSEIWFRTTAPTGMLFEVYSSGAPGADRSTYLKAGQVCFYVYTPNFSETCTVGPTLNDGAWHNVAATVGVNGQVLYVDGTVQSAIPMVTRSAFTYGTGFRVGYGYIGPNGPLTFFAGDLDDVRLWSVQRSAGELLAGRGHEIDPATPGLQGYWKLDGSGSDAIAPDATSAKNDGGLVGFPFNPSPWIMPGAF